MFLMKFISVLKNFLAMVGALGAFLMFCQVGKIDNDIGSDHINFALALLGLAVAVLSYYACLGLDLYFGIREVIYHDLHVWFDLMHKQDRDTIWAQLDTCERRKWNRELRSEIARRKRVRYFQDKCGIESELVMYIYRYGDCQVAGETEYGKVQNNLIIQGAIKDE